MSLTIDPATLAHRVRARRRGKGLGIREAAREVRVSAATFSRVERGDYLPGRENLLRFTTWLGISILDLTPESFMESHPGEPESTPEAVALHLRADKDLLPEDAEILEEVFRSAYKALLKRRPPAE
jgi:transcriptional regulator with XRE-family HTH domain